MKITNLTSAQLLSMALEYETTAKAHAEQRLAFSRLCKQVMSSPRRFTAWGVDYLYESERESKAALYRSKESFHRSQFEHFQQQAAFYFNLAISTEMGGQ